MTFARVGLAAAIACAPVTAAVAQVTQDTKNNQARQVVGQRQPTPGRLMVPVTGMLENGATAISATPDAGVVPAATIAGTFSIQQFARTTESKVAAVGTLTVSFTDPTSNAARTIVTQVAMPLARSGGNTPPPGDTPQQTSAATQACETLSLQLGPLDVTLLGLAVHLDPLNLDLTVVQGAGQRLGTLLCDVSSQLDGSVPPADLVRTLNLVLDTVG